MITSNVYIVWILRKELSHNISNYNTSNYRTSGNFRCRNNYFRGSSPPRKLRSRKILNNELLKQRAFVTGRKYRLYVVKQQVVKKHSVKKLAVIVAMSHLR